MDVAVAMPCPDIAVGTSDSFGQLVLHNPKVKMTAVRMGLGCDYFTPLCLCR